MWEKEKEVEKEKEREKQKEKEKKNQMLSPDEWSMSRLNQIVTSRNVIGIRYLGLFWKIQPRCG